MTRLFFTKLSGAGNDFILFDKKMNPDLELNSQLIAKICSRRTGIGADGVLVISNDDRTAFRMDYFNADGTSGSLCANGARCALKYAMESGLIGMQAVSFTANNILYSGQVLDDKQVKFYLNEPIGLKTNFKIKVAKQLITASFLDTGSPHVVIKISDVLKDPTRPDTFYSDLNQFPVYEIGKEIRYSKNFAPEGTNVNFISQAEGAIRIRSYERGVEDETLSCGTGTVAAAVISYFNERIEPPIKFIAKSGDVLVVDFKISNNKVHDLSLTGPAEIIFKGELLI